MSVDTFTSPGSSHISKIDYDDVSEDLTLTFTDGQSGMYRNVPRAMVKAMTESDSWGRFMHRQLKGRFMWESL